MKRFSLPCVIVSFLLLASDASHAQDYATQARMREEHAAKVTELALIENKIAVLQAEIDALNRQQAGAPQSEDISPEIVALEKERSDILDALPRVEEIKSRIEADAENIRSSYFELKEYIQRLDRLQTQNVLKTIMTLAMETAQELQAFVTVSGKPVEIVKWAAEKAADPVVKAIVAYGAPEYYSRKMKGLSDQAAATTPELKRLKDLSSLSLEGWRSYMNKYEDKEIKGNNALILGKVRVLLEQTNKTLWSLVDLYNALDREAKSLAVDMDHMRDRLKDIDKRLVELKQKDEEIRSPARTAAQERKNRLLTEISPLQQKRSTLLQEISALANKLGQGARLPDTSVERKVEEYRKLRTKLIAEIASYSSQADRVEAALDPLKALLDERKPTNERQAKEIEEIVGKAIEQELYPYTKDKTDTEALQNLKDYQDNWMKAHERHLAERRQAVSAIAAATENLERELNNPPYDPLSERILRNATRDAGNAAGDAITQELRRLQAAGAPPGQGRRLQLETIKAELAKLIAQSIPGSPYERAASFTIEGRKISGTLDTVAGEALVNSKQLVERERNAHRNQDIGLEIQKNEQEKTLNRYRQEIDARRNDYRAAARAFLTLGRDYLQHVEAAFNTRTAYQSEMQSLVNAGTLKASGESNYQIAPAYIEKTLGDTPMTCQGIDLLRERLAPVAAASAFKLAAAQAADRPLSSAGVPGAPISHWSETNEPTLHHQVVSLEQKIRTELEKARQLPYLPATNPLISFVNTITADNANLIINFPAFFSKMQESIRENDARIKTATMEAENLAKQPRIRVDDVKRLLDWHKRLFDTHESDFGCFEPDHLYNQSILPRLDELKKLIEKLKGKPLYASADALISDLKALGESIGNLQVQDNGEYEKQVAALRKALNDAEKQYANQRNGFEAGDAATLQGLLQTLDSALRQHEEILRERVLRPKIEAVSNEQIQSLYQDFINAYGRGNLRGLIALLDENWSGGDGADIRDAEDVLVNSFKVFDSIQYRISAFKTQALADGTAQISYQVRIIGQNRRQQLVHEEESNIVEIVGLKNGRAKILRTLSGNQWLK